MVPSGAENEVWSFGEDAYEIFVYYIKLRETMRPYLRRTMQQAHEKGTPVMRTLFYNFPDDPKCWTIDDQYFLGDDLLVCPILRADQRTRKVYLPEGCIWENVYDGTLFEGGQEIEVPAPLERIPVFKRKGSQALTPKG